MVQRKLYRSRRDKMIAGVCGGVAEYFDIDSTLVRIAAVALLLLGFGSVGLVYLVMTIVVPEEPSYETPDSGTKGGDAGQTGPEAGPSAPPQPAMPVAPPPVPGPDKPRGRSAGTTVGIVLIAIGLFLLAAQFMPAIAWWNLWPLIIVAAGVVTMFTPGKEGWGAARLFDGLVTVAWGVLFLAITFGVIGWDVFMTLLGLWPVLLIAVGFEILGKALHTTWVRTLGSLAIIAALAYAVALSVTGQTWSPFPRPSEAGERVTISEPVGTVDEAELTLKAGVATVTLNAGSDLVDAEGESPWGRPRFSVDQTGDTAKVLLASSEGGGGPWWPSQKGSRIDAQLSSDVLWDMDLAIGVSDFEADLSDVQVRSLSLKPGVADCSLRLGDVPAGIEEARAEVKAGVSTVVIEVPEGAEVRVESESGLTGHDIGGDLESTGAGEWETPGFSAARESGRGVWVIKVESGIGSIRVDTY